LPRGGWDIFPKAGDPLCDLTVRWGTSFYHLRTNSLAMTDETLRDVPKHDGDRILFLGDSQTMGLGVPYENTFVGILGREHWNILNGAWPGDCPFQYLRKARELLESGYQIDTVFIMLDMSDIYEEAVLVGKRQHLDEIAPLFSTWKGKFVVSYYFLREAICSITRFVCGTLKSVDPLVPYDEVFAKGIIRSRWTSDQALFESFGRQGLQDSAGVMRELVSLLKQRGIRVILAVYPWPGQVYLNEQHCIQETFWRDFSAQQEIEFLDLFPALMEGGWKKGRASYQPLDVHLSEEGHRIVADGIARYLSTPRGYSAVSG
jgi:lysophospholipase L1-like esterase